MSIGADDDKQTHSFSRFYSNPYLPINTTNQIIHGETRWTRKKKRYESSATA